MEKQTRGRKPLVLSPIAEGINRRFFQAVAALEDLGRLPSLSFFCEESGLSPSRYREARRAFGVTPSPKGSRYTSVQVEGVYYLVTRYSVSPEWLITGRGNMFSNEEKRKV